MNETLHVLKTRRSIRQYRPEQIVEAELNAVLEAGTWAPSARNLQPAVLVVVQDPETIAYMAASTPKSGASQRQTPFSAHPPWWWCCQTASRRTGFRTALWLWETC